jgi:hypothetical protein
VNHGVEEPGGVPRQMPDLVSNNISRYELNTLPGFLEQVIMSRPATSGCLHQTGLNTSRQYIDYPSQT